MFIWWYLDLQGLLKIYTPNDNEKTDIHIRRIMLNENRAVYYNVNAQL